MSKNYIEPMVVDRNGNIYISMQEYHKDIDEATKKLKEYRKYLLDLKKGMNNIATKSDDVKDKYKAKGYIQALDIITKDLKNMLKLGDEEK